MTRALHDWEALEPFGCAVDVDLSRPLSPAGRQQLQDLFAHHLLLSFAGQNLEPDDQVRVMGYLGPVLRLPGGLEYEYVSNMRAGGKLGSDEIAWHCDMQFSPKPFDALSLHAVTVEDGMTSTRFANGAAAFGRLAPPLRRQLSTLTGLNVFASSFPGRNRCSLLSPDAPRSTHPVVGRHRITGVPYLFVSWQQTDSIVELEAAESDRMLDRLFAVLYAGDNVVEHRWSRGDVVIWDNRALQHARGDVSAVGERTLQKVTVGRENLLDMYPELVDKSVDDMRSATARHPA